MVSSPQLGSRQGAVELGSWSFLSELLCDLRQACACPSDLGKGLRGHCGFCRPEPPKVIIGVWPCLPRGPSGSSPFSAHRVPLGPQATGVKRRTEQNGGWGCARIPASAQPLAPCDCSGPRFSLCAMGQQPSSAPSLRVPGEVAPDRDEEEASTKNSNVLATQYGFFTKGRKKGQPSLAETESEPVSSPPPPAQLPTGRREPLPQAGRICVGWGLIGVDAPISQDKGGTARGRRRSSPPCFQLLPSELRI